MINRNSDNHAMTCDTFLELRGWGLDHNIYQSSHKLKPCNKHSFFISYADAMSMSVTTYLDCSKRRKERRKERERNQTSKRRNKRGNKRENKRGKKIRNKKKQEKTRENDSISR